MDEKEKEVYEHLLEKIKKSANSAEISANWALALERFCNAVRTKAGG